MASMSCELASGGVDIDGDVLNEYGAFDAGIRFGTSGMSKADIQNTTFVLRSDAGDLSLADVELQDFAVRLTSVGEDGGSRHDSLKIGGTAPQAPQDDVVFPPPTGDDGTSDGGDDGFGLPLG